MALIGGAAVTRSLVAVVGLAVCVVGLLLSYRDRRSIACEGHCVIWLDGSSFSV